MQAGRGGGHVVPPMPGPSARADRRGSGCRDGGKDRIGFHDGLNSQISLRFVNPRNKFERWKERQWATK